MSPLSDADWLAAWARRQQRFNAAAQDASPQSAAAGTAGAGAALPDAAAPDVRLDVPYLEPIPVGEASDSDWGEFEAAAGGGA